jgi:peptidoglycan/LPS O-acetylase OafA/YrhL
VISGFLIINQIKAGLVVGQFSIFSFYAQGSLRILPPYLIMILATYALAPFCLSTTDVYWDFLPSAILAPLMFSNVGFYATHAKRLTVWGFASPPWHAAPAARCSWLSCKEEPPGATSATG